MLHGKETEEKNWQNGGCRVSDGRPVRKFPAVIHETAVIYYSGRNGGK